MTIINCPDCGLPHINAHRINTRGSVCLPCWKKQRGYDLTKADHALIAMQTQYAERVRSAEETINALTDSLIKTMSELTKRDATIRQLHERPGVSPKSFSGDLLRSLITLAHPDKHDNSELATEATKALLAMRHK